MENNKQDINIWFNNLIENCYTKIEKNNIQYYHDENYIIKEKIARINKTEKPVKKYDKNDIIFWEEIDGDNFYISTKYRKYMTDNFNIEIIKNFRIIEDILYKKKNKKFIVYNRYAPNYLFTNKKAYKATIKFQ